MIAAGHPESKENLKKLCKRSDDLYFDTDGNMLFALEGERWIPRGHVIPLDQLGKAASSAVGGQASTGAIARFDLSTRTRCWLATLELVC